MSHCWNWDSPNPSPALECALPPWTKGWGAHSPAAKGVGESQFRRPEKKLSTRPSPWWMGIITQDTRHKIRDSDEGSKDFEAYHFLQPIASIPHATMIQVKSTFKTFVNISALLNCILIHTGVWNLRKRDCKWNEAKCFTVLRNRIESISLSLFRGCSESLNSLLNAQGKTISTVPKKNLQLQFKFIPFWSTYIQV